MLVIDIFASLAEICCVLLVLFGFFPVRREKALALAVTLICAAVYCWLSVFALNMQWVVRTILILLVWFLVSEGAFEGSRIKKIVVVIGFWALAWAIDYSVWVSVTYLFGWELTTAITKTAGYLFAALCSRTILFAFSFVCGILVRRQKTGSEKFSIVWLFFAFIPGYTVFGIGTLFDYSIRNGSLGSGTVVLCAGLFVINVVLLYMLNFLERSRIIKEENAELQHAAELNLGKARSYMEIYRQQRAITHEFNNRLEVLESLLESNQLEKAVSYIGEIKKESSLAERPVSVNNPILDALLNRKYELAKENGITMELKINDLSAFPMNDADMVTVIGNLLDNAVNAAKNAEGDKHIWVKLLADMQFVTLSVSNTYSDKGKINKDNDANPLLHGFGLRNVKHVMKKYNYLYNIEKKDGIFSFSSVLG